MIHKIVFKGYITGSPFKLMYLADEVGVSDLSEAYPSLLLLPVINEDTKNELIEWVTSPYSKYKETERNRYIYRNWKQTDEDYNKELKARDDTVAYLEKIETECTEHLEKTMSEGTSIVVPISLNKNGNIRYLVNSRSNRAKAISKLEKNLWEAVTHRNWGAWYVTQEERTRASLLHLNSEPWFKNAKLVINSKVKRHPCVMCPNSMDQLQGGCAFGGSSCAENLSSIFKEST